MVPPVCPARIVIQTTPLTTPVAPFANRFSLLGHPTQSRSRNWYHRAGHHGRKSNDQTRLLHYKAARLIRRRILSLLETYPRPHRRENPPPPQTRPKPPHQHPRR